MSRLLPALFFICVGCIFLGIAIPFVEVVAGVCALIIGIMYLIGGL